MTKIKVDLEIDDATQYAVAYVDGKAVATCARRRVTDKDGPVWRVYWPEGGLMLQCWLPCTAGYLARRIARHLEIRELERSAA